MLLEEGLIICTEKYMKYNEKKIAVIHDHLGWSGGGERTALIIADSLGADFITAHASDKTFLDYQKRFDKRLIVLSKKIVDLEVVRFFWLRWLFWKNRKILKKYDVLIASGQAAVEVVARYAKPSVLKILYNHTPPRRIYDLYEESRNNYKWFLRPMFSVFTKYWHWRYLKALSKIDLHIANSENIKKRIKYYTGYDVDAVIWPPILTGKFKYIEQGDYFLSWARVDEQKRVDMIVEAFRKMPDKKLIIASTGNRIEKVKALARGCDNIKIIGWVDDKSLFELVGRCQATIYIPVNEDAGMTHLEANSAGKTVLGVNEGGLKESIIDGVTGLLIKENPSVDDVVQAVKRMTPDWCKERRYSCESYAKKYDEQVFVKKIKEVINENLSN